MLAITIQILLNADGALGVPSLDDLPAVFLGSASAKDSAWLAPSRHNESKAALTVLCPVKAEWFDPWEGSKIKNRGAEYKAYKARWEALLLGAHGTPHARLTHDGLGPRRPLSNDFYLASTKGEVYGLEHTAARFASLDGMLALHPQARPPMEHRRSHVLTSLRM